MSAVRRTATLTHGEMFSPMDDSDAAMCGGDASMCDSDAARDDSNAAIDDNDAAIDYAVHTH